jgi:hypothetical protein
MFGARNCAWKSTPRIMLELDRLKQVTKERGINTSRIPEIEQLATEGNCGNRDDFIGRYANDITEDNQRTNSSN